MEKDTIHEVVNDLKAKRDALCLAHEQLKKDNDDWNKCIIVLSLMTGMFESMKIKMGWDNNAVALVPIGLSSIIASISALIKFKKFPEQMEMLIQSTSLLTNTLNKCRNHSVLDHEILVEYNDSLEKLEMCVYPDIRKKYLKMSQKNLIDIMKIDQTYFKNIQLVNKGEKVIADDESPKPKRSLSFMHTPLSTRHDSSITDEHKTDDEPVSERIIASDEHKIDIEFVNDPSTSLRPLEHFTHTSLMSKPEPLEIYESNL